MRIVKVKLEKHTPISHDIIVFTTDEGNIYRIIDWEIQNLLDANDDLADIDRDEH